MIPGATATVDVVASASELLSAWIDFNGDGDWLDAGEQVFQDYWLTAGTNNLSFAVPADASTTESFARFRFSTQSGLMPNGLAGDGEVEDYALYIGLDFGDAPDTYGTLLASDGARHVVSDLRLGTAVDQESEGQPTADATGDGADEDGVVFVEPFVAGETARILVTATTAGVLDFFVDFDGVGGFGNNANEVFSTALAAGTQMVNVAVPAGAVAGPTFARFRLSSAGGLAPQGLAADGEVEDYTVTVYSASPLRDFGDAPSTVYDTVRADFGPSHFVGGPYLGSTVDVESDGQGNATATGDGRDEDGVHFGDLMVVGQSAEIEVTSSPGGGVLNFFIDFNANGQFGDNANEVFQATLTGGTETVLIDVPANATTGITYARFRISSAGGLGPLYVAPNGEVEDYQVVIMPSALTICDEWEYFDGVTAPALPADWTNTATGPNWVTVASGSDTAPNHAFVADFGAVSENRLTSPAVNIVGGIYRLAFRNYYNMEGNWDGGVLQISINGGAPQDIIAAGGSFVAGGYNDELLGGSPLGEVPAWTGNSGGYINTVVNLPAAAIGQSVQFHWVEGTDTSEAWEGWHIDTIQLCRLSGEPVFDFGDAPDPTYPTLSANDGAGHVVGGNLHLGAAIDVDANGQPNAGSTGDDTDANGDDEDGVTFTSALVSGSIATAQVVASESGLLSAWIDFNGDGDWSDPGEQVFQDLAVAAGTNDLPFLVPASASVTSTFARFRLSNQSGLAFDGLAPDGEVEDYALYIGLDFGNAPDTYGTLTASDGARHTIGALKMGDYNRQGRGRPAQCQCLGRWRG